MPASEADCLVKKPKCCSVLSRAWGDKIWVLLLSGEDFYPQFFHLHAVDENITLLPKSQRGSHITTSACITCHIFQKYCKFCFPNRVNITILFSSFPGELSDNLITEIDYSCRWFPKLGMSYYFQIIFKDLFSFNIFFNERDREEKRGRKNHSITLAYAMRGMELKAPQYQLPVLFPSGWNDSIIPKCQASMKVIFLAHTRFVI